MLLWPHLRSEIAPILFALGFGELPRASWSFLLLQTAHMSCLGMAFAWLSHGFRMAPEPPELHPLSPRDSWSHLRGTWPIKKPLDALTLGSPRGVTLLPPRRTGTAPGASARRRPGSPRRRRTSRSWTQATWSSESRWPPPRRPARRAAAPWRRPRGGSPPRGSCAAPRRGAGPRIGA